MRWLGWLALACAVACYSPSYQDCEIKCSDGTCPSGLTCLEGHCRTGDHMGVCGSTSMEDASIDDAAGADAMMRMCPYSAAMTPNVACPGSVTMTCTEEPNGMCCWGQAQPR